MASIKEEQPTEGGCTHEFRDPWEIIGHWGRVDPYCSICKKSVERYVVEGRNKWEICGMLTPEEYARRTRQ